MFTADNCTICSRSGHMDFRASEPNHAPIQIVMSPIQTPWNLLIPLENLAKSLCWEHLWLWNVSKLWSISYKLRRKLAKAHGPVGSTCHSCQLHRSGSDESRCDRWNPLLGAFNVPQKQANKHYGLNPKPYISQVLNRNIVNLVRTLTQGRHKA